MGKMRKDLQRGDHQLRDDLFGSGWDQQEAEVSGDMGSSGHDGTILQLQISLSNRLKILDFDNMCSNKSIKDIYQPLWFPMNSCSS